MKTPLHHYLLILTAFFSACGGGCARSSGTAVWIDQGEVANLRKSLGEGVAEKTEAVAAAEPTGFATLKGTFKLVGAPPSRKPLAVTKDQDLCMPGGREVLSEELVVSASGGIKDVVLYCITKMPADNPKWVHPDYVASATSEVEFDQKNCVFLRIC
jgi:hypothetical protein